MARPTVRQRLQSRLRDLLSRWGEARRLARWTERRGSSARIRANDVSRFLHDHRKHAIDLDDLDEIAAYFQSIGHSHVTIAYLLGCPEMKGLSGEEQRLVLAFRALDPRSRDAILTTAETSSIAAASWRQTTVTKNKSTVSLESLTEQKTSAKNTASGHPPIVEATLHGTAQRQQHDSAPLPESGRRPALAGGEQSERLTERRDHRRGSRARAQTRRRASGE